MRLFWLTAVLVAGGSAFAPSLRAQSPSDMEAVITTDMGTIRFEFASDKAPKHVDQFIRLTRQGYYDGSAFFRVVANGIVQGGDPLLKNPKTPRNLWGTGGLNLLAGEYSDLKHERGVVSTVRIPDKPNSDGAQFFICVSPQTALDGKFSAFGRVTEGMDVVDGLYAGYGERPDQGQITAQGKAYLEKNFPKLDVIKSAVVIFPEATTPAAPGKKAAPAGTATKTGATATKTGATATKTGTTATKTGTPATKSAAPATKAAPAPEKK